MNFDLNFFLLAEELGLLLGADAACGLYTPPSGDPYQTRHQYALRMRFGTAFGPNIVLGALYAPHGKVSAKRAVDELALRVIPNMGKVIKAALKGTGNDKATLEREARERRNADRRYRRWLKIHAKR